jgi:hypothetical protein
MNYMFSINIGINVFSIIFENIVKEYKRLKMKPKKYDFINRIYFTYKPQWNKGCQKEMGKQNITKQEIKL